MPDENKAEPWELATEDFLGGLNETLTDHLGDIDDLCVAVHKRSSKNQKEGVKPINLDDAKEAAAWKKKVYSKLAYIRSKWKLKIKLKTKGKSPSERQKEAEAAKAKWKPLLLAYPTVTEKEEE